MQNKYEILSVIGEGSYGIVYKCRNRETNEIVAIKKFKDNTDITSNKSLMRELKSLKIFNHKNIINFRESFKKKGSYFFVFDYIEKNLLEFLTDYPEGIEPNLIKHIMFQICSGIKLIHKYSLAHRDIKPENILIERTHKIKICDFGFTRFIEKTPNEYLTEYVATRWYRAPELLIGDKNYGLEIDYWSVGCIMGELIDGNPIFPGENDIEQIYMIYKICGKDNFSFEQIHLIEKKYNIAAAKIEKTKYINPLNNSEISIEIGLDKRYSGKISREALSFLKRLLDPNPKTRIKGDEIFDHPYLLNYYKIYDTNNELYVNNFDNTNSFVKIINTSNNYSYSPQKTGNMNSIIKKEMNSTKNQDIYNNSFYPHIYNTIQSTNNNNNKYPYSNQSGKNEAVIQNTNPYNGLNINTNFNFGQSIMNNNNFGTIIENFFENSDTNSCEEITNNNTNQTKNLVSNSIVNQNVNAYNGNNPKIIIEERSIINNEFLKKEISNNLTNEPNSSVIFLEKTKPIGLHINKNDISNPVEKIFRSEFFVNDNTSNFNFNNYNMEGLISPNKEERNNYNYYNNIKLYNEDLFEKTGKIKKSLNPYENLYKITNQIKDGEKKTKKKTDNKKQSGNSNVNNSNNITNKNNQTNTNFNSTASGNYIKEKDKENINFINNNDNKNLNILNSYSYDLSPIKQNKNSTSLKKDKFFNSQFGFNINIFDKNKVFLSPQKQDSNSKNFSIGNIYKTNNDYNPNNKNDNYNYTSLMNFNINNEKTIRNNKLISNNENNLNNRISLNSFKPVALNINNNNFNKVMENNYSQNIYFSPDLNSNNNTKYSNNINTINLYGNQNKNSTKNNINFFNQTNKMKNTDYNSNDYSISKTPFNDKNANININSVRDNKFNDGNQINDFLKNIIYQNNVNVGMGSISNGNIDQKRFNSLNTQNSLYVNPEENQKLNSLKKLQLPIIPKKDLGNMVK